MNKPLFKIAYCKRLGEIGDSSDIKGLEFEDSKDFDKFLQTNVLNRLDDVSGNEKYSELLRDLDLTKMKIDNISSILNNVRNETRSWVGAEAFAEAYLETNEKVLLP